ncbi:hypothetical protein [Hydrogenivirga sp. 128-5-R1-1]|uniref:hypothetical protein n=1 Tax=Hydrogenivirga sp. 128-5-R1-1 TaxID=392423 RepID=UPI00015F330D|nr:hypothetical protein [Hydrogenivirga sp. 128-5-R1-1]EDP74800.1 hypothetical protein HG1285_13067 [Hydrogenivirga sp. 128-5-R1-1]
MMEEKRDPTAELFLLFKGKPVVIKRTDVGEVKGTLVSYDPETRTVHTDSGKVLVERIHMLKSPAKVKPKEPETPFEKLAMEKEVFLYFIGGGRKRAKFRGDYVYFVLVKDKDMVKAYAKIRMVGLSLRNPFKGIEGEPESVSFPIPGKWREEFAELFPIIQDEVEEDKVYEVEFLLRDGRVVKGYSAKFYLSSFYKFRVFENPDLKGVSLNLYPHSIEDIISLENTGEEFRLAAKKEPSGPGGEFINGGDK